MKKILTLLFCIAFGINIFNNITFADGIKPAKPTKQEIKAYKETVENYNKDLGKMIYYVLDGVKLDENEYLSVVADISDDNKLSNFKIEKQIMSDSKAQNILKRLQTIISIKKPYESIYYKDLSIKADELCVNIGYSKQDNINVNAYLFSAALNSKWGPYMRDLEQRIKRNWTPSKNFSTNCVVVTFAIGRDGKLLSNKVTKSSGNEEEDKAALKAVELTAPFRPLPPEFKGNSVPIEFTFIYNILNGVINKNTNKNVNRGVKIQ